MADNRIVLIPEDPRFVPDLAKHGYARDLFSQIASDADQVEIELSANVQFFDCGANLERICCPWCGSAIPAAWWQERMEEDHGEGFKLASYSNPCCDAKCSLNDLVYDWPQGFGRFALVAMNPKIKKLGDKHKQELELILGTSMRVIYQHI